MTHMKPTTTEMKANRAARTRVRIYRHPHCERCARIARFHHRLDWLGRLESSTTRPPNGVKLRKGQIYIEDTARGQQVRGADAFALLARQIPLYWWMLPLLWIPAVRRWVAAEMDAPGAEDCHAPAGAENPAA